MPITDEDSGANRQKAGSRYTSHTPRTASRQYCGMAVTGASCTPNWTQAATARVIMAKIANVPRQSTVSSMILTGTVDAIAPRPPNMTKQPFTEASRSFGVARFSALSPVIKAPEVPKPIKARPMSRPSRPWAAAN